MAEDKTIHYRTCKRCGHKEYVRVRIKGGKVIETKLKITVDDAE